MALKTFFSLAVSKKQQSKQKSTSTTSTNNTNPGRAHRSSNASAAGVYLILRSTHCHISTACADCARASVHTNRCGGPGLVCCVLCMSNLGEEGGFAHPYIAYEDDLEGGPAGRLVGGGCAAGTRRVSHGRFQLPQLEDKLVVNGSSVKQATPHLLSSNR